MRKLPDFPETGSGGLTCMLGRAVRPAKRRAYPGETKKQARDRFEREDALQRDRDIDPRRATIRRRKMTVRAKFWVKEKKHAHVGHNNADVFCDVRLAPCYGTYPGGDSEENKSFAKYTPNGEISLGITNPNAIEFFELGKAYYIDFSPAPESKGATP